MEQAVTASSIDISGNARVWLGDNHATVNIYNEVVSTAPEKSNLLLKSLEFDRMDARYRNISAVSLNTCQWLLDHRTYQAWLDRDQAQNHGGFLWIKGKPGSGKSTIMKMAVDSARGQESKDLVLSFFFNARSPSSLEKSSLGMYRSLAHQLSSACPAALALLVAMFAGKERNGMLVEDWTAIELQNFLLDFIAPRQFPNSKHESTSNGCPPISLFVDALDEGDKDDIRAMVDFLLSLAQRSFTSDTILRVCFSSRHYPHIAIGKGLSVVIEDQIEHRQDIELYIRERLAGGNDHQALDLQQKLCNRAGGIFLWVVLVIPILNRSFDQGMCMTDMVSELEKIPEDLYNVFHQIMSRDNQDMNESIILFRWVLFSFRSLDASELFAGLRASRSLKASEKEIPAEESMLRYLLHHSKGLVEFSSGYPPVAQFTHETVRTFLLGRNKNGKSLSDADSGLAISAELCAEKCHLKIAEDCLRYLVSLGKMTSTAGSILSTDLLAPYAARHWFQHIRASKKKCTRTVMALAKELLSNESCLETWLGYHDADAPLLPLTPTTRVLGSTLYYASALGLKDLAGAILASEGTVFSKLPSFSLRPPNQVNAEGGLYGHALQAASLFGHVDIVRMLLDSGANTNSRGGLYDSALQAAAFRGYEEIVQMLVQKGADVNARGGEYGSPLLAAVYSGKQALVTTLLDMGAKFHGVEGTYRSALQAAVHVGSRDMVEDLLDTESYELTDHDIMHWRWRQRSGGRR